MHDSIEVRGFLDVHDFVEVRGFLEVHDFIEVHCFKGYTGIVDVNVENGRRTPGYKSPRVAPPPHVQKNQM